VVVVGVGGCWLFLVVVGCWLLVVGCWRMAHGAPGACCAHGAYAWRPSPLAPAGWVWIWIWIWLAAAAGPGPSEGSSGPPRLSPLPARRAPGSRPPPSDSGGPRARARAPGHAGARAPGTPLVIQSSVISHQQSAVRSQ
jgi:hypothetical protein